MKTLSSCQGCGDDSETVAGSHLGLDAACSRPAGRARRGGAGFEEGWVPAARLVRCAARTVARAGRRVASGRIGEANAVAAIFDVAAGRSDDRSGAGRAQDLPARWARAICGDHTDRAQFTEEDV